MLTEKQLHIFRACTKSPYKAFTRQEIKNLTKEKSNNALQLAFAQFKKEHLLLERKVGKSSLYQVNLNNPQTIHYIALANEQGKIVKTVITMVAEEVRKTTPFFSMAIFGSYASGEEQETSDIDVAILIEHKQDIQEIRRNLKLAQLKSLIELDAHIITRAEFIEMLTNKEENLGKQIAQKHLAVHNHQLFYDILQEGLAHGYATQHLHYKSAQRDQSFKDDTKNK